MMLETLQQKTKEFRQNRPSSSPSSLKEKYNNPSRTELKEDEQSALKQHFHYNRAQYSRTECEASADGHENSQANRHKKLPVVRPVNSRFPEALHYRTYCLADKSSRYDDQAFLSTTK